MPMLTRGGHRHPSRERTRWAPAWLHPLPEMDILGGWALDHEEVDARACPTPRCACPFSTTTTASPSMRAAPTPRQGVTGGSDSGWHLLGLHKVAIACVYKATCTALTLCASAAVRTCFLKRREPSRGETFLLHNGANKIVK